MHFRRWHSNGNRLEFAEEFGDDCRDLLDGTGGCRYDVAAGRAHAPKIMAWQIEEVLVAGIGVQKGSEARVDGEVVAKQFGGRGQAVGGTAAAADDGMAVRLVGGMVYPHAQGDVWGMGGGGDQYLFGAGLAVEVGLMAMGQLAAGLDNQIDTQLAPR